MNKTIGIIGLGTMGMGIAEHLIAEGCTVKGYDINPGQLARFAEKGGLPAGTPARAAEGCEALIMMVFNGEQAGEALFGDQGAAGAMAPGTSVIVCASIGAQACEALAMQLEPYGVSLIDSPVRGTADSCSTGTLYLMVGAGEQAYQKNKELLDTIGSTVVYVGKDPGMGQKAKTCMQAFFSLTFQTTYEVLALGTAAGLDPEKVYEILDATGASSSIFRATAQNVAARRFTDTGNPLSILDKDMKIAWEAASRYGLPVPSIAATSQSFSKSMEEYADEDVWAAIKVLEKPAGIEVKFTLPS